MNIFFANINGRQAILNEEESWHCVKVLRKKTGDAITVIDGKGQCGQGTIAQAHPKQCMVTVDDVTFFEHPRSYRLHVAIAPTKNMDRIEWFVEKAVEIGVDEITFLKCKNSERTVIKTERILGIVESAVKQSLQYYLPKVQGLVDFDAFVNTPREGLLLIAHCEEDRKQSLKNLVKHDGVYTIMIGPEGDFHAAEIALGKQQGYIPVSLGETRLRTETAGLYACNAFSVLA